jgi:ankyrin repeat protein
MKVIRAGSRPTKQAPAANFTGTVFADEVVVGTAPSRMRATVVSFTPGARTAWHAHPVGQTLCRLLIGNGRQASSAKLAVVGSSSRRMSVKNGGIIMESLRKLIYALALLAIVGPFAVAQTKATLDDLIDASKAGEVSRVETLLAAGAEVNGKGANGVTPLFGAAVSGHLDVVKALLAAGADVNAKTVSGFTALTASSERGYVGIVQALLLKNADVNAEDVQGATALMMASQNGHMDIVKVLLAANADVNAKSPTGVTALMVATVQGQLDVLKALLAAKADVNAKMTDGSTALAMALKKGNPQVVELLKTAGTNGSVAAEVLTPDKNLRVNGIPLFAPVFRATNQAVNFLSGGDLRNKVFDFTKAGVSALAFSEVYSPLGSVGNGSDKYYVGYFAMSDQDRRFFVDSNWVFFPGALRNVEPDGPFATVEILIQKGGRGVSNVDLTINDASARTDNEGYARISLSNIKDRVLPLKIALPGTKNLVEYQVTVPVVSAHPFGQDEVGILYKGITVNLSALPLHSVTR